MYTTLCYFIEVPLDSTARSSAQLSSCCGTCSCPCCRSWRAPADSCSGCARGPAPGSLSAPASVPASRCAPGGDIRHHSRRGLRDLGHHSGLRHHHQDGW